MRCDLTFLNKHAMSAAADALLAFLKSGPHTR
jgi:hypothetical protein